jgi:hypothetical protein
MADAVAIGAFVLAVVFSWSGVAKLRNPLEAASAMTFFGVLSTIRAGAARLLAAVELAVAAGLAASAVASSSVALRIFSAVALTLSAVFSLLIGRSLRRGDRFSCHCFGATAEPLSVITFARAALLVATATLVVSLAASGEPFDSNRLVANALAAVAIVGVVATIDTGRRMLAYGIVLSHQGVLHDRR